MRVQFDANLPHQRDAITAVLDALDAGNTTADQTRVPLATDVLGVLANALPHPPEALMPAIQAVQARANLPLQRSPPLSQDEAGGPPGLELAVEMETGTGKTYTYLRTIIELSRRHALTRWLIVVPSVAIREGVLGTLRDTAEHFRALAPDVAYRFWAYDGQPTRVRSFATSSTLEIGVLTIDAFNKISNRLRRADDRFSGRAPIEWIAAARPCLVLDEPHHYSSALSKASLSRLRPTLTLRYGATHREPRGLIHRLTPRQAAERGLVKRVEVADLGDDSDGDAKMSAQIYETVRLHVQRQAQLASRGIKVLSLLFVDRVASYTDDDGAARVLFDQHFEALKHGCPTLAALPAEAVRSAYFATKKGVAVETSGTSVADENAYQLIMRDKARLLSPQEPVAFVFSHSALREGWDNPNVFQVCTLAQRHSAVRRRQEIGRGIRLCVDSQGHRVADPQVDVLSVIPAEPYDTFVAAWKAESDAVSGAGSADAPPPTRAGSATVVRKAAPLPPVAWVDLDSAALVADAIAHACQTVGAANDTTAEPVVVPHDALLRTVVDLLGRRRPTIALTDATIAAVVDGVDGAQRNAARIADAIATAVAAQGA